MQKLNAIGCRFLCEPAIEPEYLAAFDPGPADVPVQLLSLGTRNSGPVGIRPAQSAFVPDASIFDAFATCTEAGPDILLEEDGDASICSPSPAAREKAHLEIFEAVRSFLSEEGE
ncbi:hypothetical protein [Paenirhodobacter populi]|uniref:Uncharacterized protein n=1 Tax=Paenirhodobacter populi TaxID=2306993 RepID=A0A443IJT6_9RHOB|nr:hypothetical protein [Sinirhodobacter populi]RWR04738.1 hypothetical protein D2T33_20755 [Sinirhodobacter populi]